MPRADRPQTFDEFNILGKPRFAKLRALAPEIVWWKCGGALASHCTGEQPRGHRRIRYDSDAALPAKGQNLRLDSATNERVRRLKRSHRGDFLGAFDLLDVEVGYADPADLALLLQPGHRLPGFLKARSIVRRRPVHLVEIDDIDLQAAQAVFAFLADRIAAVILADVALFIPAQDTFCENVRPRSAQVLQRLGNNLFRMADSINCGSVNPVHAEFDRVTYRRD